MGLALWSRNVTTWNVVYQSHMQKCHQYTDPQSSSWGIKKKKKKKKENLQKLKKTQQRHSVIQSTKTYKKK